MKLKFWEFHSFFTELLQLVTYVINLKMDYWFRNMKFFRMIGLEI